MNNKWGKLTNDKGNKVYMKFLLVSSLLLTFFMLFFLNRDLFSLVLKGDIEAIRFSLTDHLLKAYLLMLVIMIIQNSFTLVPLILVITINITLFGVIVGFLWSWITSILAAILVFTCVRYLFKDQLLNRFSTVNLMRIEEKGFTYVFQARIFPFVPTSLINILAGVTAIRFRDFLFATVVGNFLFFMVLSLIPAGLLTIDLNEYEIGMILFLCITLFLGMRKLIRKKRLAKESIEEIIQTEKEDVILEEKHKSN